MKLRDYQSRAVRGVYREWSHGRRTVLVVVPTGGGKTIIALHVIMQALATNERVLFVVHTRDLLRQTVKTLRAALGNVTVSADNPHAPVFVATVQGLMTREKLPQAHLIVLDEAHHHIADEWGKVVRRYPMARILGLTATPERQDGRPLGDLFEALVVGALYSELIEAGHLVDCMVYQPPSDGSVNSGDLACNPVDAYEKHAPGSRAFCFAHNVKLAKRWANEFDERGHPAGVIVGTTPNKGALGRERLIEQFSAGSLDVLSNVYCLTEGIDVPAAATCILARSCRHVGTFLQMVGRILRPSEGKTLAVLIDLSGATHLHGMPTEDREYSLEGEGIRRINPGSLRTCPECGCTAPSGASCPECGFVFPIRKQRSPHIYALELQAVYAGAKTPDDAKLTEYKRLRHLQRVKRFELYFVIREYKKLFGVAPIIHDASPLERRNEAARLRRIQMSKGYKPGWMSESYRRIFGHYPQRGM